MPTLAAALYLLVMRFMTRRYEEVCQMVNACQSDTALSPEEQQIWPEGGNGTAGWTSPWSSSKIIKSVTPKSPPECTFPEGLDSP